MESETTPPGTAEYHLVRAFAPFSYTTPNLVRKELDQNVRWTQEKLIQNLKDENDWKGKVVVVEKELNEYAEDYGHIIHEVPSVVLVPNDSQDVCTIVKIVLKFNKSYSAFLDRSSSTTTTNTGIVPIHIIVRGGGGNPCGATQIPTITSERLFVLLDTTLLNTVSDHLESDKTFWVGAGCTWTQVLTQTEKWNMRPIVLPDYLDLTVGGTVSIGGIGAESVTKGPVVNIVTEIECVDGLGNLILTRADNEFHKVFHNILGGMGQFGIMTRLRIKLEANHNMTRVYHFLTTNLETLLNVTPPIYNEYLIDGTIHSLQGFALQNSTVFIKNWVLFGKDVQSETVQKVVDTLTATNKWAYLVELTVRFDITAGGDNKKPIDINRISETLLQKWGIQFDIIYAEDAPTSIWDRRLTVITIPVLVQTGSWSKRHTWLNIFFSHQTARQQLQTVMQSLDPVADLGLGHIGITALHKKSLGSSMSTPNISDNDWVYLLVLGRDEQTGTDEGFERHVRSNRFIWNQFSTPWDHQEDGIVQSSIYPTSFIPDWDEEDWRRHFSPKVWAQWNDTKKVLDPYHLFGDSRSLFIKKKKTSD